MTTTIFSRTFNSTNPGWQGNVFRVVIQSAALSSAPGTDAAIVSFEFAVNTNAGVIDSAYIGHQGSGNLYNFDGNQKQLKFNGSASKTGINGAVTIVCDKTLFAYDSSKVLIVSARFSGTAVDVRQYGSSFPNERMYYAQIADTQTGATAPTGTFTDNGTTAILVPLIQMDLEFLPLRQFQIYQG